MPVNSVQKPWLSAVPWDSVLTLNKALCQAQKVEATTHPKAIEKARQIWEATAPRSMSLKDALDLCRKCYETGALLFNNGNTFAAISRTLLEEPLKALSPVEAQIIRTTVSHYVVGLIGRRELLDVLRHYEAAWNAPTRTAKEAAKPVSVAGLAEVQPQV